jgi:hypothetical protein
MPSARELALILKLRDEATKNLQKFTQKSGASLKKFATVAAASFNKVKAAARKVGGAFRTFGREGKALIKTILNIKTAILGLVVALGVRALAGKILRVGIVTETLVTRLTALKGSTDAAQAALSKFDAVAANVPFSLQEVIESGVQLQAFLTGTGLQSEDLSQTLADLASFMGISMPEAASAWGRAMAGGAGAADIFRERGILPIIKEFAGVEDLTKLTLPEFRKAMIEAFRVDPRIAGSAAKLSQTWRGVVSMIGDQFDRLSRTILDTGLFEELKDRLTEVLETLRSPRVIVAVEKIGAILRDWVDQIDLIEDIFKPLAVVIISSLQRIKIGWLSLKVIANSFLLAIMAIRGGIEQGIPDAVQALQRVFGDFFAGFIRAVSKVEDKVASVLEKFKGTGGLTEALRLDAQEARNVAATVDLWGENQKKVVSATDAAAQVLSDKIREDIEAIKKTSGGLVTDFDDVQKFLDNSAASIRDINDALDQGRAKFVAQQVLAGKLELNFGAAGTAIEDLNERQLKTLARVLREVADASGIGLMSVFGEGGPTAFGQMLDEVETRLKQMREAGGALAPPSARAFMETQGTPEEDPMVVRARELSQLIEEDKKNSINRVNQLILQGQEVTEEQWKTHMKNMVAFERTTAQRRLGITSTFIAAGIKLAEAGGKKTADIARKLALAQAIVDGIAAIQAAVKNPPGWPFNAGQVAAVSAFQAANVAAIASATFGGGSAGRAPTMGAVGGGAGLATAPGAELTAPAEPAAPVAPTPTVIVQGDVLDMDQFLRNRVAPHMREQAKDGVAFGFKFDETVGA